MAELCASKFLDQDHDGLHDPGEADIAGWFIHVADPGATVIATLLTGVNGCTLVPGMTTYTVSEVLQNGWTQTFPPPPGTHVVFLECGQVVNLEFGNVENPAQHADPNGHRHRDPHPDEDAQHSAEYLTRVRVREEPLNHNRHPTRALSSR